MLAISRFKEILETYGDSHECVITWDELDSLVNEVTIFEEKLIKDAWVDGYKNGLKTRMEKITDPAHDENYYLTKIKENNNVLKSS